MPGLLGIAGGDWAPEQSQHALDRLGELLMHRSFYRRSPPFSVPGLSATHIVAEAALSTDSFHTEAGITVWFDGESYQSEQLRAQLQLPQTALDGASLLLAAYRQGQHLSLLRQIEGIFCAVIYDAPRRQVHLISDRYGLRRLYWTVHRQSLVWCPELKALLGLPGYCPRPSREAIEDFLGLRYVWGDRSFLAGVELLPAATFLTWDLMTATCHQTRYWWWSDLEPDQNVMRASRRTQIAALGDYFQAAVRIRCRPQDAMGITLSGGLDSRALLAAALQASVPVSCLTYGQPGSQDAAIATQLAELTQSPLHRFEMSADNWLAPRVSALWEMDAPCSLLHAQFAAPSRYSRLQGLFTVNLHGEWGDKLSGEQFFPPDKFEVFVRRQLNLDGFARSSAHHQAVLERGRAYFAALGSSSYVLAMDSRLRSFISKDMRISQIEGITTRFPFLDHDLQQFVYSLPVSELKSSAQYHRMLLRQYPRLFAAIPWQKTGQPLSQSLPQSRFQQRYLAISRRLALCSKPPQPLTGAHSFADYDGWLNQQPARQWVDDLLRSGTPLFADYVDPIQVQQDWLSHQNGSHQADRLGTVITLEIWLRQMFTGEYRRFEDFTQMSTSV